MNILIINQYCENRGDEAAGSALVHNINEKVKCKIDIIYNSAYKLDINEKNVSHRNEDLRLKKIGIKNLLLYFLFRNTIFDKFFLKSEILKEFFNTINKSDYVFVSPCGASIGIYKDWPFLIRILMVVREKKRPIFCLNTIGKSGNICFDLLAKYALKRSQIYVRDKKSFEYIKKLNLEVKKGIDTAFSLPPIEQKKEKICVFVPTLLDWHPTFKNRDITLEVYNNLLPAIVKLCKENQFILDIMPHTYAEKEIEFIDNIAQKCIDLGLDTTLIRKRMDVKNHIQYDKVISCASIVIGMRYHSIVLAAKNKVPYLALAYEYKMIEVSNYTNCTDNLIDIMNKRISEQEVYNKLSYITKNLNTEALKLENTINKEFIALSKLPMEIFET